MKKTIVVLVLVICFSLLYGCTDNNKYVDTKSIITHKEIVDSNQYYFYVDYEIEGMEGIFEATVKVKNKTIYDSYKIGDEYTFKRPVIK